MSIFQIQVRKRKYFFQRPNLETGAGGGDFWRLLSLWLLVGRGMPEPFNALLIAFSSSTLVIIMVMVVIMIMVVMTLVRMWVKVTQTYTKPRLRLAQN